MSSLEANIHLVIYLFGMAIHFLIINTLEDTDKF